MTKKGFSFERKCKDILEFKGYYVIRSAGSFGLFDLVAIKGKDVLLIQCKHSKPDKRIISKYSCCIDHFWPQRILFMWKNKDMITYSYIDSSGLAKPLSLSPDRMGIDCKKEDEKCLKTYTMQRAIALNG
jgi:hypothetical protein